jgi:outer membrane scaffolding protein for murein synthesis (MipA/OmpV family)
MTRRPGRPSRLSIGRLLISACLLLGLLPAFAAAQETEEQPSEPSGWGLGFGVIRSPRPYVGADDELFPVPLVQYHRGGIFIEGIRGGYRWSGRKPWRVELFAMPQFAGLDPDDSPFLAGMEERDPSVDLAAGFGWSWPHVQLSLTAYSDLLNRNDGRRLRGQAKFPFSAGRWRIEPSVGAVWYNDDFVDYYAGVRPEEALPWRPAYSGSSTTNPEAGIFAMRPFARRWLFVVGVDVQNLGSSITDSPVVDEDTIVSTFIGVSRRFVKRPG